MAGVVINARSATGDVVFLSSSGKQLIEPSKDVRVSLNEEFAGVALEDALLEAKKFAVGAIKQKVEQKTRGFSCNLVVKKVDVKYTVKYGL